MSSDGEKTLLETISRSRISPSAWLPAMRQCGVDTECSHHAGRVIRRYGKGALFSTVEWALFCTSCERGGPVRLEIHKLPRN
ncbi:hypothetical protein EJ077_21350 [Mesorhizobium sp. M8A.F.Ca.ET.057.01.1.1]|nr:hypothetical protein EJ077_21350 [Mesorhizobium sp. M8A.F.Ca.ET.057.01.1.1]RWE39694.1 MAG: hypothetical protein EOS80_31615 [Mesorhizobium sp.]